MTLHTKIFTPLMAIIVLFFIGCSSSAKNNDSEKLKIGILTTADMFPVVYANQQGYFKQAGIEVEIIHFQSAQERDTAFQGKHLDGMQNDLVGTIMMKNAGVDSIATLMTMGEKPGDCKFGIVTGPNSGIHTLEDLKGKPIGMSSNTIVEYLTDTLLLDKGFTKEDINKSMIPKIYIRLQAVLENKIAAAAMPDPFIKFVEEKGGKCLVDDQAYSESPCVIVFHKTLLTKKEHALKEFHSIMYQTFAEVNAKKDELRKDVIAFMRFPDEIKDLFYMPRYAEKNVPSQQQFQSVYNWLKNHKKIVTKEIEYTDVIDSQYLEKS